MTIRVSRLDKGADISPALGVREQVFQLEQGIPAEADFDGLDQEAEQFVAYDDDRAVGAARYRLLESSTAKVERVAVLPEYRGQRVGRTIMQEIARIAREQGLTRLILDAQFNATRFYTALGYQIDSDEFEEVGLPHVQMALDLNPEGAPNKLSDWDITDHEKKMLALFKEAGMSDVVCSPEEARKELRKKGYYSSDWEKVVNEKIGSHTLRTQAVIALGNTPRIEHVVYTNHRAIDLFDGWPLLKNHISIGPLLNDPSQHTEALKQAMERARTR